MSSRRSFIGASIATAVLLVVVVGVAWLAVSPEPWVRVDRTDGGTPQISREITSVDPLELAIDVPRAGISRLDLTFNVEHAEPAIDDAGSLIFNVSGSGSGSAIWRGEVPLHQLPGSGPSQIMFPEIQQSAYERVIFEISTQGVSSDSSVTMSQVACDCTEMITMYGKRGGVRTPIAADPDVAIWSSTVGRRERLNIALDRIEATNPNGFGRTAILVWGSISAGTGLTLYLLLCYLMIRNDLLIFRGRNGRNGRDHVAPLGARTK